MLLQEIRTLQAIEETGLNLDYSFSHKEPYVQVGDKRYVLVFPNFMFEYDTTKSVDKLFIGLKTDSREVFLNQFDATIIYSDRGRRTNTKALDEWYFKEMAKARFVLCPDGDFVWTYRFFESIIFKAIPIVQNVADVYDGYKFYTENDYCVYRQDWVEYNFNKAKKELTL